MTTDSNRQKLGRSNQSNPSQMSLVVESHSWLSFSADYVGVRFQTFAGKASGEAWCVSKRRPVADVDVGVGE